MQDLLFCITDDYFSQYQNTYLKPENTKQDVVQIHFEIEKGIKK